MTNTMCSNNLLILLVLCISYNLAKELTELDALSSHPKHCTYEYAYDMYGAHCAGLRLNKLPNLRGGIEILDFSDNKLQELTSETFAGYTSIKFLYLTDNQIYLIEEDALTSLTSLQTLDLSNNVILELPSSLFQLQSLRKLYLKGNPLLHKSFSNLEISQPIRAPIVHLDLSDCKIRELPNWGSLPQLVFYNISHNPLTTLDPEHFAGMCNLEKLDLTESLDKMRLCDLKPAVSWFQAKKIYFQLPDYSSLNSERFQNCPLDDSLERHNTTYQRCKNEYLQVQNIRASRRTWLTIGGGLAGFLVGFILLLYVMHRHNVARTKTTAEKIKKKPLSDGDKNANAILLNDVA